jgi:23S rRNA (adenine2503-C2)-methyltransferase
MGMGEPAHNLDNVLEAIDLLGTAGGIGHKAGVLDGRRPAGLRAAAAGRVKPALALSLHSTKAERFAPRCCRARRATSRRPGGAGRALRARHGYPIQYQWTLLKASTTATTRSTASWRLLRAATR